MIENKKMYDKVVKGLINKSLTATRVNLDLIGLPYPPPKGWLKALRKGKKVRLKKKKQKKVKKIVEKTVKNPEKNFYKTIEWARLRYKALSLNNGCCELCGRSKQDGIVLHVDHINPFSKFPELRNQLSNLQVLCAACNWGKGASDYTDWREPSLKVLMGEDIT